MDKEESIFLAKRSFTDLVFNAAYMAGCKVTVEQTQTILKGDRIKDVMVKDIETVLNLRDAWNFILDTVDEKLTLDYVCKVNSYVSRNQSISWGTLRDAVIWYGDLKPSIPDRKLIMEKLEQLEQIDNPTERALEFFCYACKQQIFWDGNKRTATMIACKIIMESGCGIFTIGADSQEEFNKTLHSWCADGSIEPVMNCLKQCIKTRELRFTRPGYRSLHDIIWDEYNKNLEQNIVMTKDEFIKSIYEMFEKRYGWKNGKYPRSAKKLYMMEISDDVNENHNYKFPNQSQTVTLKKKTFFRSLFHIQSGNE